MTHLYFPRLERGPARALLAEYSSLAPGDLVGKSALTSRHQYWYPTAPAGLRVDADVLGGFQAHVRDVARAHGYPAAVSEKSPAKGAFDRQLVADLPGLLPLLPVEAGAEPVWSFLSLVVLPDVALWRWPNSRQRDDYERVLGYPRNVFRRLWWRGFVLGSDPDAPGPSVLEDEAVAILERTSVGGNRRLARSIAASHLSLFATAPRRTDLLRDAMKRIRRLHAFVAFHALDDAELDRVVVEAMEDAADHLLG